MNYWQNYPKFMVSLLKALYGKAATKENEFGYEWLPKVDGNYSWMYIFDDMYRGNSTRVGGKEPGPEGLITFGMNPVGIGPELAEDGRRALEAEVAGRRRELETETATFWKAPREYGGRRPLEDPDRGVPASGGGLRREGRHLHELGALDAVEVEGARSARDRRGPTRRSWRASSSPCASSTGRRAARFPSRS